MLTDKNGVLNDLGLKRCDLFITTKVGPADQGFERCRASVLKSLANLKLDYVNLVLIHWPGTSGLSPSDDKHASNRKESWRALEQLVKENKVKSIGVSNYGVEHLRQLLGHCVIKPVVNQVEFHPLLTRADLLSFCKSNDIVMQAYSSLGSPKGYETLSSNATIQSIASAKQKTVAQILLKWSLEQSVPVLPKTSKEERLATNFDLFSFKLSQEEVRQLGDLNQNLHFCWNSDSIV